MDSYQMSKTHISILRKNRIYLLRNIIPSRELLDYLWSKKILTADMKEEIEMKNITKTKVACLLDILPKRGPQSFRELVLGLLESGQLHVAQFLDADLVNQNSESGQRSPSPIPELNLDRDLVDKPESCVKSEEALMEPDIRLINVHDPDVKKLIANVKEVYPVSRKPRGRVLIINNTYFMSSASRPRIGAEFDSRNLHDLFEKLGFQTDRDNPNDDVTAEQMRYIIKEESQHEGHRDADCFIAFIMSHGSHGYVYGIDGEKVSIQDDIVAQFEADRCKALIDKPKIFFFQACQGESSTNSNSEKAQSDSFTEADPALQEAFSNLHQQDTDSTRPTLTHSMSDIIQAYSTVPGYKSWRYPDRGSWFVRAVVEVFSEEAYKEHVLSMLVKVRQRVTEHKKFHTDEAFEQLTRTDDTTKKKLYFFPGYYET